MSSHLGFEFDLPDDEWLARVRGAVTTDGDDPGNRDHSSQPTIEQPGDRVGPYELIEPIGAGGMGTVWRARRVDEHFHRTVAIKLIKHGMDTAEILRRFRFERQILATLVHPHIARLYDGGATDCGRPYLVMEYVDGAPLLEYCRARGMDIEQRIELFRKVCLAVHHAHSNLILHRDLKPSNVLVTADGLPKLLDFGIAKFLQDDGTAATSLTATEVRVLTPRYASPEQLRGERLTTATDTYSLGVLLYELLVEATPYRLKTDSRREIEHAVLGQEIRRPSIAVSTGAETRHGDHPIPSARLRGDVDTIVMTALQKDPARRYASVELLAADIERYLQRLPISAAPDSVTYRASRFVRRNKGLVGGVFTAVLALLTATAVATTFAVRESQARAEADQRAMVAQSINAFLNNDLLSSADPRNSDNPNLTVREALDRAADRVEERFRDQPLVEAAIRHTIGETYRGLRLPGQSVPHLRRAVELRAGVLGKQDEETRQAMRDLLTGLYESDRFDEGLTLGEELLALDIEAAGSDSANAMDTLHLLARYDSGEDGDVEPTIAMLRSVLEWDRNERGVAHSETLSVMHTLANVYIHHHRVEEAAPLIEEIWEVTSAHYEPSDPETLDAMLGLAILYGRIDRVEEAVVLIQEAVQIQRDTKPQGFANTGIWLTHLGQHLSVLERYEEAEAAYLEAYEILSASLGPEAGWTQGTVRILAQLYEDTGDVEKAAQWRERLLPEYESG